MVKAEGLTPDLQRNTNASFTYHQFQTMTMFFQIPTAMLQNLVEQFPGRVEAFLAAKGD